MSDTAYIKGLVGKDQYQETTVNDWERCRAEDLRAGEVQPLTNFEIHFLQCCKGLAEPACPKEAVLLKETASHDSQDHFVDFGTLDDDDEDSSYGPVKNCKEPDPGEKTDSSNPETEVEKLHEKIQHYAFFYAIQSGDIDILRHLLGNGISSDLALPSGATPLLYAAEKQDLRLVELLLEYNAWPFDGGAIPILRRFSSSYEDEEDRFFYDMEGLPSPFQIAAKDSSLESSRAILLNALKLVIAEQAESVAGGPQADDKGPYEITTVDFNGNSISDQYSVLELAVFLESEQLVQAAIAAEFDVFGLFDERPERFVCYPDLKYSDRLMELAEQNDRTAISRMLIETRQNLLDHPNARAAVLGSEEKSRLQQKNLDDLVRVERVEQEKLAAAARREELGRYPYKMAPRTTEIIPPDDEIPF